MEELERQNNLEQYTHFVGVRFFSAPRSYFFGTTDHELKKGDAVVVETQRGLELGVIDVAPISIDKYSSSLELKPILRRATDIDKKICEINKRDAKFALEVCRLEVERLNLKMNLISCEYTLDKAKVIFSYLSDERVDFRELLKSLANKLHTRIELRQVGSRDKAKLIGGIGICGLPLCCASFLNEFDGISINRAKNQMLVINIPKLSGHCGKLICCLKFEDDAYTELKKDYPEIGTKLWIDKKEYTVTSINVVSSDIRIEDEETVQFIKLNDLRKMCKWKSRINKNEQK